jgi:HAD superfamily hydrolase (TIGR01490 family)
MKKLVIFDLDGTLVRGQSQRIFLNYLYGKGLVRTVPYVRLYLWFIMRWLGAANEPEKIMRYAFSLMKRWRVDVMDLLVADFFQERMISAFYPGARELVERHEPETSEVMLVSNSLDRIVGRAAGHLGIKLSMGTRPESAGGRLTGRIAEAPVFGGNKKFLVKAHAESRNLTFSGSWAYGDSISDLPLLEMVENPVAVNPDRRLYHEARQREWKIIRLDA